MYDITMNQQTNIFVSDVVEKFKEKKKKKLKIQKKLIIQFSSNEFDLF